MANTLAPIEEKKDVKFPQISLTVKKAKPELTMEPMTLIKKPHKISLNEVRGRQLYDYYFSTFKNEARDPVNLTLLAETLHGSPPRRLYMDPTSQGFYSREALGGTLQPQNLAPLLDSLADSKPALNKQGDEIIVSIPFPAEQVGKNQQISTSAYLTDKGFNVILHLPPP